MVSVTASAEYGAPLTILPPKFSEEINTKSAPGGGNTPSGPWKIRSCLIRTGPSGACCGCWANAIDADAETDRVAASKIPRTLFISSFLSLNKTYGTGQTIDPSQD